jgi:hypothetical protein
VGKVEAGGRVLSVIPWPDCVCAVLCVCRVAPSSADNVLRCKNAVSITPGPDCVFSMLRMRSLSECHVSSLLRVSGGAWFATGGACVKVPTYGLFSGNRRRVASGTTLLKR